MENNKNVEISADEHNQNFEKKPKDFDHITLFPISEEKVKIEDKIDEIKDKENVEDSVVREKFELAWKCLIPALLQKCTLETEKNGPGINYFNTVTSDHKKTNCEFNYICKNSYHWNLLIVPHENYLEIIKNYDEKEHVLVAINIPTLKKMEIKLIHKVVAQNCSNFS